MESNKTFNKQYRDSLAQKIKSLRAEGKQDEAKDLLEHEQGGAFYEEAKQEHREGDQLMTRFMSKYVKLQEMAQKQGLEINIKGPNGESIEIGKVNDMVENLNEQANIETKREKETHGEEKEDVKASEEGFEKQGEEIVEKVEEAVEGAGYEVDEFQDSEIDGKKNEEIIRKNEYFAEILKSKNKIPYEKQKEIAQLRCDDYDENNFSFNAYYKSLLAARDDLSEEIINILSSSSKNRKGFILLELAKRSDLSELAEINIFKNAKDEYSKSFLIKNENLSPSSQEYIANLGTEEDLIDLANNKNLSKKAALILSRVGSNKVKANLATNRTIDNIVQNILMESGDIEVLNSFFLGREEVSPVIQKKLFDKNIPEIDKKLLFLEKKLSSDVKNLLKERYKNNNSILGIIEDFS